MLRSQPRSTRTYTLLPYTTLFRAQEQLSSLATGAIDGVCVWQPWVQLAGKKISVDVVHTGAHSYFAGNDGKAVKVDVTRGIIAASAPFVKANPKTIEIGRAHV